MDILNNNHPTDTNKVRRLKQARRTISRGQQDNSAIRRHTQVHKRHSAVVRLREAGEAILLTSHGLQVTV